MSRFTGSRIKVMRALGTDLPGLSAKKIERRPVPPGPARASPAAVVSALPDETAALFPLRVQLVVEFYSQRL